MFRNAAPHPPFGPSRSRTPAGWSSLWIWGAASDRRCGTSRRARAAASVHWRRHRSGCSSPVHPPRSTPPSARSGSWPRRTSSDCPAPATSRSRPSGRCRRACCRRSAGAGRRVPNRWASLAVLQALERPPLTSLRLIDLRVRLCAPGHFILRVQRCPKVTLACHRCLPPFSPSSRACRSHRDRFGRVGEN